ncbi:MAG: type 4a pilus biogenesis protein PilO [Planctomycetaceae bacterium]|nr:type 4a pilus biogenesis protein PilO [Planctomycetaceae bacterium]
MSPQKRERLLAAAAALVLLVVLFTVLPLLFANIRTLQRKKSELQEKIEKHERNVRNEPAVQRRLADLSARSLLSKEETLSEYHRWLMTLAQESGLKLNKSSRGTAQTSTQKNAYKKFPFTLEVFGRLEQLAEFLRMLNKADYLHSVQSVTPSRTKKSDEFDIVIKVDLLSLPQVRNARMPKMDKSLTDADAGEKTMLTAIKSRSILSEYVPPPPARVIVDKRPDPPPPPPPPPPPRNVFDESPYCYVTAILDVDGIPQCWIDHRTAGQSYKLSEGGMFRLGNVRCSIKKIDIDKQRVQIEAAGGIYTVKIGKSFAEFED